LTQFEALRATIGARAFCCDAAPFTGIAATATPLPRKYLSRVKFLERPLRDVLSSPQAQQRNKWPEEP
jgi:hypothetical protein